VKLIDWTKPIRGRKSTGEIFPAKLLGTARHCPSRIVFIDKGSYDVIWMTATSGEVETEKGSYIENVPERHTVWINLYGGAYRLAAVYATRELADAEATSKRIACIKVEFEEGVGLTGGVQ
jgi:hypothetical protein